MKSFEFYKKLKDAGFPQGGVGNWQEDINSTEKVYIPTPSEVYAQLALDPEQWNTVRDALCQCFIDKQLK